MSVRAHRSLWVAFALTEAVCAESHLPPSVCHSDASLTIAQQVPPGQPTHGSVSQCFSYFGGEVTFTEVDYGPGHDCIGVGPGDHCFYAALCAVEDGNRALLYYASWWDSDEPQSVPAECPWLHGSQIGETWPSCRPSGFHHPVTQTDAFLAFARAQAWRGPFRACFNRYYNP